MNIKGIKHGFSIKEKNGVKYLTIPSFEKAGGIICAFSTRLGGVSEKPFDSLNFSLKREENKVNFNENLRRFGDAAGYDYSKAVIINYAHTNAVYYAKKEDAGSGIIKEPVPVICDGLCTDEPGLPLMTFHADCTPLFFYDKKRRAAVICHAGWRGVSAHMAQNAVASLVSLGCRPADIIAAVGPCISVNNYEVGQDVCDIFKSEFGNDVIVKKDNKPYADLTLACLIDILNKGIPAENITVSDLCTYRESELFFSHRRDNGRTGAMAAVIEIV